MGGFSLGLAKGPRGSGNRGAISYGIDVTHETARVPVFPDFGYRRNFGDGHAQVLARPFGFHWDRETGDWGHETGLEAELSYRFGDVLTLEAAGGASVVYDVNRKTLGDPYTDRRGAGYYSHVSGAAMIDLPEVAGGVQPFVRAEAGAEHTRYTRRDQAFIGPEGYFETTAPERRTHGRGLVSVGAAF